MRGVDCAGHQVKGVCVVLTVLDIRGRVCAWC